MQFTRDFSGASEINYRLPGKAGKLTDFPCKPSDVNNRMAGKNVGNSMGQVTGQAFSWPLMKLQFKIERLPFAFREAKLDIKRPVSGITEQSLEKRIRAAGRE